MREDCQRFYTRYLYHIFDPLFISHPLLYSFILASAIILLAFLLLMSNQVIAKMPRYSYMFCVVFMVALIDTMSMKLSIFPIYLIVFGIVLVRSDRERISIMTLMFAGVYLGLKMSTSWYSSQNYDMASKFITFVLVSWIGSRVRQSFVELKMIRGKNLHLVNKLKEAQHRLWDYNDEIEETYRRDYLTGLYNLGGFQEQVHRGLEKCCNHEAYHVISIDLTDFKRVNMREGIEFGDQLLIRLGSLLKKYLPPYVHLARYDGDQFAIGLLADNKDLRNVLQSIDIVMEELRNQLPYLRYCIGTATYPEDAKNSDELIRRAEERLAIEQRRVRHNEEEKRRHLEKLSAVGQLAAGLAHEIRNPLTSIRGFVQISAKESKEVRKWESIILPEIDRINDLLKQFLNLSEIRPTKHSTFTLDQLMNDVFSLMEPKAILMGHELTCVPPKTPVNMEADSEQLKQVLINLIQNGLDALVVKGRVELSWKEMRDRICIHIHDSGEGIKPENMNRIFDPFFTTKDEGTGMGLSICHRIIMDHGGQIHMTSLPGRGTTFHIHIPRVLEDSSCMETDLEANLEISS
ncbi:ATP-binding protein [Shimazuella alba]|uniref:histidine kinase n=1 Tax=Shimazuella alba TaxID=2690964 RepID=A0A6I4VSZ1_9BACL|nr:ATP-binding protein [Shimazuella alba]MXQ53036.1 diguanylate cyclase [Shimazuella alba]